VATAADTRTLPYDWYVDPAVLRVEQERIFADAWQYAGPLAKVSEPGTVVAVRAGHVPVILTRGRDCELRGFVNVCRHRGAVLCEGEERRETIQCPYHAWTYDLDGSLRTAPRAEREIGFDRAELGLVPVSVETWGPFVFVNPTATAAPLAEHLGELPLMLAEGGIDVDSLEFSFRAESDPYDANWKVIVENYLECYHCSVAHPSFSKAIDVSPDKYRLETRPTLSSQVAMARNGGGGVYDASGPVERGHFHSLFPSTLVNVMPGHANLSIGPVLPLGPERSSRFLDYFFAADVEEEWKQEYLALDEVVGAEDRLLVERVQAGLRTGAIPHGYLMPESERLIAHFQSLILAAVGGEF
jgi:phenylpropionate dioxygenase-like ring-hydroxylating dioxygenase large terminal subunit